MEEQEGSYRIYIISNKKQHPWLQTTKSCLVGLKYNGEVKTDVTQAIRPNSCRLTIPLNTGVNYFICESINSTKASNMCKVSFKYLGGERLKLLLRLRLCRLYRLNRLVSASFSCLCRSCSLFLASSAAVSFLTAQANNF